MALSKNESLGLIIDENGIPLLDQFSEEGFVDCTFKMNTIIRNGDFLQYEMLAFYNDEVIGFGAQVFCGISAGLVESADGVRLNTEGIYRPAVRFFTLGAKSDRFLEILLSLYGGNSARPLIFIDSFPLTGIALHTENIDLLAQPVRIKLFGNDTDGDDPDFYFESFYNLDIPNGYVYWNEKDPEYRTAILSSLSK